MSERMIGAIVGLITVIIVLIMLAFIESHSETKVECMLQEDRDTVLRLSLAGVDKGFQQHVASLFIIWVQDPKTQQPARAQKGIQNGIDAYVRARHDAKAWLPVIC